MTRAARDLANMVDMLDDFLQGQTRALRRRLLAHPAGDQHPGIQRRANHRAALDERLDLLVAELPIVRHERATILVACPHRTGEQIKRFPEAVIAEMCHVEYDA